MTSTGNVEQSLATFIGTGSPDSLNTVPTAPVDNDAVVLDLWESEAEPEPVLAVHSAVSGPERLKQERETLTRERERLKYENSRLLEELESIQLEEEIAQLKNEVDTLGSENAQLLNEIERRRLAISRQIPQ